MLSEELSVLASCLRGLITFMQRGLYCCTTHIRKKVHVIKKEIKSLYVINNVAFISRS